VAVGVAATPALPRGSRKPAIGGACLKHIPIDSDARDIGALEPNAASFSNKLARQRSARSAAGNASVNATASRAGSVIVQSIPPSASRIAWPQLLTTSFRLRRVAATTMRICDPRISAAIAGVASRDSNHQAAG
jgi:hypothetical protein